MRFFYDTEFIEDGTTIDLVSIGIVGEDGREFYAVSTEFDPDRAGKWVRANVLPKLPRPATGPGCRGPGCARRSSTSAPVRPATSSWGLDRRLRPRRAVPAVGRDARAAAPDPALHP